MILLAIGPVAYSTIVGANGPYFVATRVVATLAGTVMLAIRATMQVKKNAGFNNIKTNSRFCILKFHISAIV